MTQDFEENMAEKDYQESMVKTFGLQILKTLYMNVMGTKQGSCNYFPTPCSLSVFLLGGGLGHQDFGPRGGG